MSSPARILHVLPWVTSGGVERRRLTLARGLPKGRFEQRVVCMEAKAPLVERIREEGVSVDVVPGNWTVADLRAQRAIRDLIARFDPDIVHGAVFEGVVMASLSTLGSRRGRGALIVEEIDYPVGRSWRGHLLFAAAAHRASRCVAVSPAVRTYLEDVGRLSRRKVHVIPNGVEEPTVPGADRLAQVREELGIPRGAFVVGSLGRADDAHKRFSDLLRATAQLASRLPQLHLLIVGGGRDLAALEALATDLGVRARVSFPGYREDVGTMYGLMDVFALVSNRESFGLVLAEAMYTGLPVICSGVGGMTDVVVDEDTGLYVGVGDVPRIAAAIERLHGAPDLRRTLGESGKERVVRLFSAERYCRDVAALYDDLLGAQRPRT